jgi:hypothetical protein
MRWHQNIGTGTGGSEDEQRECGTQNGFHRKKAPSLVL